MEITPPQGPKINRTPAAKTAAGMRAEMFMFAILPRIIMVTTLRKGLGPAGQSAWAHYQHTCDRFPDPHQRLQFLSAGPEMFYELNQLAQVPEQLLRHYGLTKNDFLDYIGFASLCGLEYFFYNKLELDTLLKQGDKDPELMLAYKKMQGKLEEVLANPAIPNADKFVDWVETFRVLLKQVSSPNIFLSFHYPSFIWITQGTLAKRFVPDHPKFGKWIINARDPKELVALAQKLLPHCATQNLGTIKFEPFPHSNGICFIAIYCHETDPVVEALVTAAAGKSPFWCYDEYCYAAEAITDLFKEYGVKQTMGLLAQETALPSQAEELLKRGTEFELSPFQIEVLYTLLDPGRTAQVKPDTALGHIINTYFRDLIAYLREQNMSATIHDYIRMLICAMCSPKKAGATRQYLAQHRQRALNMYPGS